MSTVVRKFWRMDSGSVEAVTDIIDTPSLTVPAGMDDLRAGHGILVATWDEARSQGRIHALGVVTAVDKSTMVATVEWRRANFTLRPNPSGRTQWRTRANFGFSPGPAERYGLKNYFTEGDSAPGDTAAPPTRNGSTETSDGPSVSGPAGPSAAEKSRSTAPQCNRVSPSGELVATTARGTFMGNRAYGNRWLVCELHFERQLREPRKYAKLFFLDEAVAFAAGHRPCPTCRRHSYKAYMDALRFEYAVDTAAELDNLLTGLRRAPRPRMAFGALPDGAFFELDDGDYRVLWRGALHRWTPEGYTDPVAVGSLDIDEAVVLTPDPSVVALRHGYPIVVHPSIGDAS